MVISCPAADCSWAPAAGSCSMEPAEEVEIWAPILADPLDWPPSSVTVLLPSQVLPTFPFLISWFPSHMFMLYTPRVVNFTLRKLIARQCHKQRDTNIAVDLAQDQYMYRKSVRHQTPTNHPTICIITTKNRNQDILGFIHDRWKNILVICMALTTWKSANYHKSLKVSSGASNIWEVPCQLFHPICFQLRMSIDSVFLYIRKLIKLIYAYLVSRPYSKGKLEAWPTRSSQEEDISFRKRRHEFSPSEKQRTLDT